MISILLIFAALLKYSVRCGNITVNRSRKRALVVNVSRILCIGIITTLNTNLIQIQPNWPKHSFERQQPLVGSELVAVVAAPVAAAPVAAAPVKIKTYIRQHDWALKEMVKGSVDILKKKTREMEQCIVTTHLSPNTTKSLRKDKVSLDKVSLRYTKFNW